MRPMNRRAFLQTAALTSCARNFKGFADGQKGLSATSEKLILSAPLTHSDWMLKPGIAGGDEGVRHMLDACKAAGWSKIYWRAFDGGRSLYKSKLLRAQGKWDDDSFWHPKSDEDKTLLQRFTPGMTPEQRTALINKFEALDYEHFDSLASAIS